MSSDRDRKGDRSLRGIPDPGAGIHGGTEGGVVACFPAERPAGELRFGEKKRRPPGDSRWALKLGYKDSNLDRRNQNP